MQHSYSFFLSILITIISFIQNTNEAYATHAQGADLTYTCLGNNQYEFRLSFYRDCSGVNAPQTINMDLNSATCNANQDIQLTRIQNTGQEVTPICPTMNSTCTGGNYPGVQEYVYTGVYTLPFACTDWTASFTICCRNFAISTIQNPGNEAIYLEAVINNFDYPCNSSPTFSNPPVPFVCAGQTYCFNHGATDIDGDSLAYSLVPPATGPNTTVTYLNGYSATQPLLSNPAISIDPITGDICMTPTLQEVTVLAVLVEEYRNGVLIGAVTRDIQVRSINCTNNNPQLSGIDGTNQFTTNVCAGNTLEFDLFSSDPDANQNVTVTWNGGINGATFTTNNAQYPTGTFTWTPTAAQISNTPYCFTVTVSDDNCPLNGTQTFGFCITVAGFDANVTTTDADCSNPSGSATVQTTGGSGIFAYQWNPGLGQLATQNNLAPGNYSVDVTDPSSGCNVNLPFTIANGAAASNLQFNTADVACHGGANGTATVVPDGQGPFTYDWSNGSTNASIQGLSAGTYNVTVTNGAGCVSQGSITINEPNQPVNVAFLNSVDPLCNGQANGSIEVASNGGVAPYFYTWSNNAAINGPTQQNLQAGQYGVIVTDANACSDSLLVNLSDPATVVIDVSNINNVSCFGGNDGSVSVTATGGNGGFTYQWTNPVVGGPTLNGVPAGSYTVEATDVNGCVGTLTAWVTEPDALTVTTASTDVTCNGYADGSASVTPAGGTPPYSYNWAGIPNSTSSANNLNGGLASVTITDQNSCSIVENINIYEPAPLAVTLTPSDTICPGGSILLESNVNGGTSPFAYDWNAGQNAPSINVSPNQTTQYDLVITDANGCVAPTLSSTVWVNNIQDVQVQLTPSQDVCLGSPAYIGATTVGGIGTYNLTWNQNNWTGNGQYTDYPDTSSWYVLTITDDCQNQRQDSVLITVNPLPEIDLLPAILDNCGPMELPIADYFSGDSAYTYFWDFGNGQYGGGMHPYYTINQSGAYLVEVTATNQFGCTQSLSAYYDVTIHSEPVAQFNADQNLSEFNPIAQFINQSANGASWYEWSFGDGDSSNAVNPEHAYQEPGSYTVTLVAGNEHGCSDTTDLTLNINREFTFYVPNAFTPDGDGINDEFFGQGMNYDEIEMFIYDRWGEMIFESDDPNARWDGTEGGQLGKQDVYVYRFRVRDHNGRWHTFDGHVALLK